jgi:hypothetical protein
VITDWCTARRLARFTRSGWTESTAEEHGVLQILAADPETVAFVPVYAFFDFSTAFDLTGWSMGETVVAMEFVEDDGTEPDEDDLTILIDRLVTLEVLDHDENWRVRNGRPVIIDCGGF